jgi:hypothetical protein
MEDPTKISLVNEIELRKDFLRLDDRQKKTEKLILSQRKLVLITIVLLVALLVIIIMTAFSIGSSVNQKGSASNPISVINNFPNSVLFSVANELMDGNISPSSISLYPLNPYSTSVNPIISNGKDDVFFLGATSCQFCARTRIPLSIALAKFGSFSKIYGGYSVGDGDYPTIFWTNDVQGGYNIGSYYTSKYVNFIVEEEYEPNGFSDPSATSMELEDSAIIPFINLSEEYINLTGGIATPLMLIGDNLINGAPTNTVPPTTTGSYFSSLNATAQQTVTPAILLSLIESDNNTYATDEIAGADMYIASICKAINMTAPICGEYNWTAFYNRFG